MSRQLNFNLQQEYEVIEYPGRVVNTDRMVATLGGIVNISKVGRYQSLKALVHNILAF